jgi:hypothetical protein
MNTKFWLQNLKVRGDLGDLCIDECLSIYWLLPDSILQKLKPIKHINHKVWPSCKRKVLTYCMYQHEVFSHVTVLPVSLDNQNAILSVLCFLKLQMSYSN